MTNMGDGGRKYLLKAHSGLWKLHEGVFTLKIGFGFFVFLFVGSLAGAVGTNMPTGSFFTDLILWAMAFCFLFYGTVVLARVLRARRFGDRPPMEAITGRDVLENCICALGGPLLLIAYVPVLWTPGKLDAAYGVLIGLGVLLTVLPVWAFWKYVSRA